MLLSLCGAVIFWNIYDNPGNPTEVYIVQFSMYTNNYTYHGKGKLVYAKPIKWHFNLLVHSFGMDYFFYAIVDDLIPCGFRI